MSEKVKNEKRIEEVLTSLGGTPLKAQDGTIKTVVPSLGDNHVLDLSSLVSDGVGSVSIRRSGTSVTVIVKVFE